MNAETCIKKLEYVGTLAFATVDENGAPQIRNISAVHYDGNAMYFFTARGKNFCRELLSDGRVQVLAHTKYNEIIRLSAVAKPTADDMQPYLGNVYPNDTRKIGIIFEIKNAVIEYFNLGVKPIFRESYIVGEGESVPKGYRITDKCVGCGKCLKSCPQSCITDGKPFTIKQENCLHCGACLEVCPVKAVERLDTV